MSARVEGRGLMRAYTGSMYCGEAGITVRVWANAGAHPMVRTAARQRKVRAGAIKVRHRIATRCSGSKSRACVQSRHKALPRRRRRAEIEPVAWEAADQVMHWAAGSWTARVRAPLAAALMILAAAPLAQAQSVADGQTYFSANCTSGCHSSGPTSPYTAPRNGGNASAVISYAASQGMVAQPGATALADLAAYLNTFVSNPFPVSPVNVAFQGST